MKLQLDVEPTEFEALLSERIRLPGARLPWLAEDLVVELIHARLARRVDEGALLAVKMKPYRQYKPTTLARIMTDGGVALWYLSVQVEAPRGTAISDTDIQPPQHLQWRPLIYAKRTELLRFKHLSLKTRERYTITVHNPFIPAAFFRPLASNLRCQGDCDVALLDPTIRSVWDWRLQFVCRVCSRSYVCGCFKRALEIEDEDRDRQRDDTPPAPPVFREAICQMCVGAPSNLAFCAPMHGSTVLAHYGPWIRKLEIEEGLSRRDAENRVRERLGVPPIGERWLGETMLYRLISMMFAEHEVVREASPDWLGRQRLDIFIPSLGLAVEYQGEQHFTPVARFGGEKGLERAKTNDRRKRNLCASNGVDLVYVRHDEQITEEALRRKLHRYLNSSA